jgi:hypothetical protein
MEAERQLYKVNPSLARIGYSMYEYKKTLRIKGKREGIVDGIESTIFNEETVSDYEDRRTYWKIFTNTLEKLSNLSKYANKLYAYIIKNKLKYGEHKFVLVAIESMRDLEISNGTMSKAISELVEAELIYRTDIKYQFFINLEYISYGDEVKIYKEFVHTVLR